MEGGHSTISELLSTTARWFELLDAGKKHLCGIFFEYWKAFDTVLHRPLMEKLVAHNLNRYVIQWNADYLTLRTQQVMVEGETSKVARILPGIPQGSVLGHSLFLLN